MKINTALLLSIMAIAVRRVADRDASRWPEWLGALVATIAGATAAQSLFGADLGIDQWWMRDPRPSTYPGRMAPATSIAFMALGAALLLRARTRPWLGQGFTLLALMIAVLSLCGYVYGAHSLYTIGSGSVSVHTALGFVIVSVSLLAAQPGRGVTEVLASDTAVARTVRRSLPLIAFGAPTYGWLCMHGYERGYYAANFGFALVILGNMTSVTFIILKASARVHRLQQQDADDQRLLIGVSEVLGSPGDPDETLQAATRFVGEAFRTSRCLFTEVSTDTGMAVVRGRHEPDQIPMPSPLPIASFSEQTTEALRAGRSVINTDLANDPRTAALYDRAYRPLNIAASVSVPLMRDGAWVATFAVTSTQPRAWEPREITLMQHLASHTWAWYERHKALVERQRLLNDVTRLAHELERRVDERTAELRGALAEKEVLIKEVHHRVKNNLQVISSLLRLQGHHVADARTRAMFTETQDRVQSIALVHEKLYQSRDLAQINFEDYVRSLVRSLLHSLDAERRGIAAHIHVPGVFLSVDVAVPCGMVINELVTNALKHAFLAGQGGQITVALRTLDAMRLELVVSDNGCGLAEDFDPRRAPSLGLDLVFAFADQVGATIDWRRQGGTSFCMVFPKGELHAS